MIEKEILKHWGFNEEVTIEKVNREEESYREENTFIVNGDYILKGYKNKEEAFNNIYIGKVLNNLNIQTQKVIKTLDSKDYFEDDFKCYTLLKKIDGEVLKDYFQGDFISRGRKIGQALGELHLSLNKITEEVKEKLGIFDNDLIGELNGWVIEEIDKYLEKSPLEYKALKSFRECIEDLLKEFPKRYYKLERQVIHRDFHGGNIIFKGEEVVGFIDFDLSQINARLFDICYLCTGSLGGVFNDLKMRDKWKSLVEGIFKGYDKVNKLTLDEINSIKYMMISIEMIMIAYFAREGYEDIANSNIKMVNYLKEL